jgi:hypothetical protein
MTWKSKKNWPTTRNLTDTISYVIPSVLRTDQAGRDRKLHLLFYGLIRQVGHRAAVTVLQFQC